MVISIVTGSRADYGLLSPLITECEKHFDVQLIVTGGHLSHEFGHTLDCIEHEIAERVECVLSSDTAIGISKGLGLAVISFSEVFERIKPDMLVVLGDRWEILACSIAAHMANIPISHIHGGEVTKGAYDDAFRHSITKMSQLHFVAAEPYRKRVIQLGENPDTVFNVGALGCDGLFKREYDLKISKSIMICIHPETADIRSSKIYEKLRPALPEAEYIVIMSNPDVGYSVFEREIKDGPIQTIYKSMPRDHFLMFLEVSDVMIGNSSAGIIEAPALGVPTINVGDRQKGRLMADSIIQAEPTKESIQAAFDKLYSKEFQDMMKTDYYCPYQGGQVAEKIVEIIKDRIGQINMKKGFYDIP